MKPFSTTKETDAIPAGLQDVMGRLASVAMQVAHRIARGGIDEDLAGLCGTNTDGDGQKALDVIADDMFCTALEGSAVRFYASEEQETVVTVNEGGTLAVAIDPLDGSSNIDTNLSIGTIFAIYPAEAEAEASFLRPGSDLLAGGYVIYGPQTCMVVSFGRGTLKYVLDPDINSFVLVDPAVKVKPTSTEFAINASNYRHWPKPIRAYIDDCVAGTEGPRGRNFNMRWLASLVAEAHRIISRGGVFLYPRDSRKGYENGRLRYVYECAPIALVITQAGGGATDGENPILSQTPSLLHARTPFIFGSSEKVARITAYHDLPEQETSALFGNRGLFRS
ncbi:D-fructose 1,6-bisphosphatase [Cereibacter ovatus]|uniref:Fructose-1,6-bisphosphatase class 1 n=1 Tax=Cereibacter ovatus TaxID=439529 RepID=A0A285CY10_9RHOB|nr:class 1 fructose-bisphosphatase [Cereibacter ovatus]SNX72464.1 D-fructose 1,6-bisphosphatase [Cereibacter ovatus]